MCDVNERCRYCHEFIENICKGVPCDPGGCFRDDINEGREQATLTGEVVGAVVDGDLFFD